MTTLSSIHAWKIPWTKELGGLQSMGLQRVGHDWATFLFSLFLQAGGLYFLLIVESVPCKFGWTRGLWRFPDWGNLCSCSNGWSCILSLWKAVQCRVESFLVSMGLIWLWAACLLKFRIVSLFCWRISMGCLALQLAGSWVELGLGVSMEVFWWFLVY